MANDGHFIHFFQFPSFALSLSHVFLRYITILSPEAPISRVVAGVGKPEDGVDLRTLRAIRVLRPLKLVSGVPSKYYNDYPAPALCGCCNSVNVDSWWRVTVILLAQPFF